MQSHSRRPSVVGHIPTLLDSQVAAAAAALLRPFDLERRTNILLLSVFPVTSEKKGKLFGVLHT